ncbi:MAG: hypothetical protein H6Q25_124 [Bacteroidetes bacterium]|nr:hypothetical protein [Bacteroidota bacterium]
MNTFIALLRGINVSGHNLIKMTALKTCFQELDFQNIKTYLQSGNIVFQSSIDDTKMMGEIIKQKIEQEFGFSIPVLVITLNYLEKVISQNPFLNDSLKDPAFFHVTFLYSDQYLSNFDQIEIRKKENEAIVLDQDVIYLYCPDGYGQTKLTNTFIESKLKVGATTRNWKTVNELLKMV